MERLDIVHAYRTMLDMHEQVEDGKQELVGWFESEGIQEALARRSDSDPYVDPFGEDATGFSGEDSDRDFDDEFFTKE
jgi:hypothetical protein